MAINFVTGLPRQGKTLYTLWHVKHRAEKEKRQVFTCNLTGVNIDGWKEIDHPDKWMEVEDNCIIIVDELQDFWPKVPSGQKVPLPILELSKHGKRGIDFYFITQEPNLVHSTPRDLCESHYYVVRTFGTENAMVYKFRRMQLHPDRIAKGGDCEKIPFPYPKNVYAWYKSADVHNVKRNIPWKVYAIPVLIVFVGVLLWVGVGMAKGTVDRLKDNSAKTTEQALPPGFSVPGGMQKTSAQLQQRAGGGDPVEDQEPRIAGLPHTAPRYDSLTQPTTVPYPAACVSMGERCSCYTQQGTHLDTPKELCLQIVKKGFFVDFGGHQQEQQSRQSRQAQQQSQEPQPPQPQQQVVAAPITLPRENPQRYAAMPTAGSISY